MNSTVAAGEDKTTAIVSYLTIIGFIAAIVIHGTKKTSLGAYHLRQSLGLMLTSIAMIVVGMVIGMVPFVGWLVDLALWFGLMVLWFTGLIAAIQGERKPVVLLGEHFQKWFGGAFE
jgi:uncharacterized membrane protein